MTTGFSLCSESDQVRVSIFGRSGTAPGLALWHEDCALTLEAAIKEAIKETKYGRYCQQHGIVWTYYCRDIRGGTSHSEHSHCLSFDLNPPSNPMRDDGLLISDFDRFGLEDGVKFINIFKKHGFEWGAEWHKQLGTTKATLSKNGQRIRTGRVDPMHFQYVGPPEKPKPKRTWTLRWRGKKKGAKLHTRVFLTAKRMRHFIRKHNRQIDQAEYAKWVKKVDGEVVQRQRVGGKRAGGKTRRKRK